MNNHGLILCSRFAYPPNSYNLCGPPKQNDLAWYAGHEHADGGLSEILSQFSTLYPYLCLIAAQNALRDPFDRQVVEAYWIGNHLLHKVTVAQFAGHLTDMLGLKRKISKRAHEILLSKLPRGGLAHHAFHVLNVWRRTGHVDDIHTIQTMEACLINWGKIKKITPTGYLIQSKPLVSTNRGQLVFGAARDRMVLFYGGDQSERVSVGNWISYHWGFFCTVLNRRQLGNLIFYTQKALDLCNRSLASYEEKKYLYLGQSAC